MTAEPEYIITVIDDGKNETETLKDGTLKIKYHISSIQRYNSQSGQELTGCAQCEREIRQSEREKLLDKIVAWKRKHGYWFTVDAISGEKRYHFEPDRFDEFIEELRQEGKVEK